MSSSETSAANETELSTIVDCFYTALPVLHPSIEKHSSASASGTTTKNAVPPSALIHRQVESIIAKAQEVLEDPMVKTSRLTQSSGSTDSGEFSLGREGGVVNASMIHLIRPILNVLRAYYGGTWVVQSEFTRIIADHVRGIQETESTKRASSVRHDLVFNKGPGENSDTIAVVEFKKRANIRYRDFVPAILPCSASKSDVAKKVANADAGRKPNFLKGNAVHYMGQTATYAHVTKCCHTALFNWDYLLLLDFHQVHQKTTATAGTEAYITWISEDETDLKAIADQAKAKGQAFIIEEHHISMALLGWLIQAFEDAGYKKAEDS